MTPAQRQRRRRAKRRALSGEAPAAESPLLVSARDLARQLWPQLRAAGVMGETTIAEFEEQLLAAGHPGPAEAAARAKHPRQPYEDPMESLHRTMSSVLTLPTFSIVDPLAGLAKPPASEKPRQRKGGRDRE